MKFARNAKKKKQLQLRALRNNFAHLAVNKHYRLFLDALIKPELNKKHSF